MDAYIKHSPVPSKISVQVYLGVCSLALLHLIGKCVCVHAWALGLQSCYSPGSRVQENLSCRAEALWKDGEQVLALGQFVLLCIASHCGHPLDMQLSSCPGVANCVGLLWGDLGGGRFLLHFGSDCSVSICPLLPTVHCPRCKSSLHQEQGKCAGFSFSKTTWKDIRNTCWEVVLCSLLDVLSFCYCLLVVEQTCFCLTLQYSSNIENEFWYRLEI